MNQLKEIKEQLAIKYGAMLTLDEVSKYFGCKTGKSVLSMYCKGQFPVPITTMRKPNSKYTSKVVMVEHLAPYLADMKKIDEKIYNRDQRSMAS
jgi:hypothetical protein